jgi:hypothetical protein
MVRFAFAATLTAICLCGCVPPGRGAEPPPQCTLRLPQTTLAALPANAQIRVCKNCGCPCETTGNCACGKGTCYCSDCPGQRHGDAPAVTLDGLKQRAMAENTKLVVWTGTTGHDVSGCLTCRDERTAPAGVGYPFVSVGVPSANGLVWWQFPARVPDAALRTVRTDGVHDLLPGNAAQPHPASDWRHWQTAYPAPYLNAAPMSAGPQWQPFAPQAMSFAPMAGCPGGL